MAPHGRKGHTFTRSRTGHTITRSRAGRTFTCKALTRGSAVGTFVRNKFPLIWWVVRLRVVVRVIHSRSTTECAFLTIERVVHLPLVGMVIHLSPRKRSYHTFTAMGRVLHIT